MGWHMGMNFNMYICHFGNQNIDNVLSKPLCSMIQVYHMSSQKSQ